MLKFSALIFILCLVILLRPGAVLANSEKTRNCKSEIRFEYSPSALSPAPGAAESVFLTICSSGKAHAVRYGPYQPTIIAVYGGVLARADVENLRARVRGIISESSRYIRYASAPQDREVFHLSILRHNNPLARRRAVEYWEVLRSSPAAAALVNQLRELWKRLNRVKPADAYLRTEPIADEVFRQLGRSTKLIPVQKFPRNLRPLISKALRHPYDFNPLSKRQFERLLAVTSDKYFTVVDDNSGYSSTLHLPQPFSQQPPK